jgi:hypothetical protein
VTVIYKYGFGETAEIDVPEGEVRLVAARRPSDVAPTVWVEHPLQPGPKMRLRLYGTGDAINRPGWTFVGSAVCANGEGVWHVFRSPRVTTR